MPSDEVTELAPMIRARLESILRVVQLEVAGQPVEVTAFRLLEEPSDVED